MAPLDLTAGEAATGGVGTQQIIVALIGALALILVALVPVLITSARREASTTTPPTPPPDGSTITTEEAKRLWDAIEKVKDEQARTAQRAAREHGALEAGIREARSDLGIVAGDLGRLRDRFHRHAGSSAHRPHGPDTDA